MPLRPLCAALAAGLALAAAPAAAQTAYTLACRGGGSMSMDVVATGGAVLYFTPAATGADAVTPNPGHCAWLDRGFRGGEPARVVISEAAHRRQPRAVTELFDGMMSTGVFYLQAHAEGGALVLTRTGR